MNGGYVETFADGVDRGDIKAVIKQLMLSKSDGEAGSTAERWAEAATDAEIRKVDNARKALLLVNADTHDDIAPLSPFGVLLSWKGIKRMLGLLANTLALSGKMPLPS